MRLFLPGARRSFKPYLFLMPMLLFAVVFVYYPFLKTVLYSVSNVNIMGRITGFAGLENYAYLFSRREFSTALSNTLKLTALNVPITLAITLLLARLLKNKRLFTGVFETFIASTMAVSMGAASLIFKVLLNPTVGLFNHVLGLSIGWYQDRNTALYGILLLTVWMGIGYNFLLFLSAFRAVPRDILDSARMDGANAWQVFWKMEVPLVFPTVIYMICTNTILALMTSGPILILTQGGPARSTTTLIYLMYSTGYGSNNYSMAACVSVVTFGITLFFTIISLYADGKKAQSL
ncbi:MAG: sugar ABC transporter permease [Clostridia bacterium]|nr:sugar ABC transporter permease [Clostridia bacterium]